MDGGRTEAALSRIEAALARIEAVARHNDMVDGQEIAILTERHQRLRQAVGHSLRQLDDLIARQTGTLNE